MTESAGKREERPPVYGHGPLLDYLLRQIPPVEPITVADYSRFNLHSPGTNFLRWYCLHCDVSDLYLTELISKEMELMMLPAEKQVIMPRAADLFWRFCAGNAGQSGWIPLFTRGPFLFLANYDPLELLPAHLPDFLVQKVLVTANSHDYLLDLWRKLQVDLRKPEGAVGPFPAARDSQAAWLAHLGVTGDEIPRAMACIQKRLVPLPLNELSLKLVPTGIDQPFLTANRLFPFFCFHNNIYIAASSPSESLLNRLEMKIGGMSPVLIPADQAELEAELKSAFEPHEQVSANDLPQHDPEEYLRTIVDRALSLRVSDIHLEPVTQEATGYRFRFRLDGVLVPISMISNEFAQTLINKIKLQSDIDISERRQPRDGSFTHTSQGREYDIRVSVIPMFDTGDRIVLRMLDNRRVPGSLEELGFATSDILLVNKALNFDHGLFIVSGPTGAGKSTTLYAAVRSLPLESYSLQSVEDPCEFRISDGCAQFQVNAEQGLTYERLLKQILRSDPDFIMVGEVRDPSTAKIASVAANTGHLVLTTLHANDAISSIYRLKDLGVPQEIIADCLRLVISQRLLRKLCRKCRYKQAMTAVERSVFLKNGFPPEVIDDVPLYMARGCNSCNQTGYRHRFALVESLFVTQQLADAIAQGAPRDQLTKLLEGKFRPMYKGGLSHVLRGETSFKELSSLAVRDEV